MKRMTKKRVHNILKYIKYDLVQLNAIEDLKKGLKVFSHDGDWFYWMEKQNKGLIVQVSNYHSNDYIGTILYDINNLNEQILAECINYLIQKMNKIMRLPIEK